MTKIFYKPQAIKSLKKFPQSQQKKILKKIELLSANPLVGKAFKGELAGLRSLRIWPYRIIYEFKANRIIILMISHRQSIYKN